MELGKIAEDAIGATQHAVLTCYRCTKQASYSAENIMELTTKALRDGWSKVGDLSVCRRCSK